LNGCVSWQHRLPDGVGNFRETSQGFEASISIPADEEGFFGRECPDCDRFFKMRVDQWEALADDAVVNCPYCGHQPADVNDFMTSEQNDRVMTAAEAIAEQFVHEALGGMLSGLATPRLRPGQSGIQITVSQDPPPPVGSLTTYTEQQVRRTINCDNCETVYAVYGATAFCPVCGPRAALDTVLESIERGRRSLALEDALPEELREQARADGVFDKAVADSVKETVTLFEVFARDQFASRVPGYETIIKPYGRGVFQRLDDVDALYSQHCGFALSSLVPADAWSRLQTVFQQRHVLVHRQGIVDADYLQRVPHARQQIGQRLVLEREDAERALDALEAVVRALAATP
jgi:Zn finger protein HypA/HybF involved in hydrogenase expression